MKRSLDRLHVFLPLGKKMVAGHRDLHGDESIGYRHFCADMGLYAGFCEGSERRSVPTYTTERTTNKARQTPNGKAKNGGRTRTPKASVSTAGKAEERNAIARKIRHRFCGRCEDKRGTAANWFAKPFTAWHHRLLGIRAQKMVAGPGIEPGTRGFSVPCSTD